MGNGDAPKREHLLYQTKDGKVLQKCSTTYNFVKEWGLGKATYILEQSSTDACTHIVQNVHSW